jgi:hypothetical protein
MFELVYNCPVDGDYARPAVDIGVQPSHIPCPKCKQPIPLVRTSPFRDSTFGGRMVLKDRGLKEGA